MVMKYTKKNIFTMLSINFYVIRIRKITLEKWHTSIYNKNRCC